ncbi:hypothetical protein ABH926_009214 [Catenulispora sp. GP43]|uniref:acyl-CoA dehydrogenase family protein n=1 Tax=Catenulispora sp. GP43 TaxID=3156263 RepID=UPI003512D1C9
MDTTVPAATRPGYVDAAIAIGRGRGLAAGLEAALEGLDPVTVAPSCYVALTETAVPAPNGPFTLIPHRLAEHEGIRFVRLHGQCPQTHAGLPPERAVTLAAVRLGVLYAMLDAAIVFLSDRTAGGVSLIDKQLVMGTIADTVAEAGLLREALTLAFTDPAAIVGPCNEQLSALGWQVAALFGASGYLEDHPVRALYVSELVAGAWSEVSAPC